MVFVCVFVCVIVFSFVQYVRFNVKREVEFCIFTSLCSSARGCTFVCVSKHGHLIVYNFKTSNSFFSFCVFFFFACALWNIAEKIDFFLF